MISNLNAEVVQTTNFSGYIGITLNSYRFVPKK